MAEGRVGTETGSLLLETSSELRGLSQARACLVNLGGERRRRNQEALGRDWVVGMVGGGS